MGYLKELIATEARQRRCRAAWEPHLDQTKSVIARAAGMAAGHDRAVVLGGGLLADVPLRMLAKNFRTVELVDVCFAKSTRRKVWSNPHIAFRTCDITGVAAALGNGALPVPGLPADLSLGDADLVVSANMMSQLPLVPLQYVRRKQPHQDEEILNGFARDIVRAHLAFLQTCPGTVCLISEVERQFLGGENLLDSEDPLFGVPLDIDAADACEEWFWDIAPRPEVSPDYGIRNRVQGMVWRHGTHGSDV
jgi:hypothetical protein